MNCIHLTANKDFAFPHLDMHQDTYKSLFNYFISKMFKPSVYRKATWTLKVNRYIITLCVLYGLELPTRRKRGINTEMLRGFIGYAGSSNCLKRSLNDFVSFGILENNYEYSKEAIKYRLNIDHEVFKLFKPIEGSRNIYSLEINPDKFNSLVTAEYIIKEWNKNNKTTAAPSEPVKEPIQAKVEKPAEEPQLEEEEPIELHDITGKKTTKVNRDTVAVLTKVYNMKKAGDFRYYENASSYYNAHIREFRKDYPNAADNLSTPTIRGLFKIWEEEDNCEVTYNDSSLF